MKKLFIAATILGLTFSSPAIVHTFTAPTSLQSIDHSFAYSWGMNLNLAAGEQITGARLTITDIWDWRVETDRLYISLLDDPTQSGSVREFADVDDGFSDYFTGGIDLVTWSDPNGGVNTGYDFIYNFSAANLITLRNFITDTNGAGTYDFSLGFDPDCHYYNSGITFEITTTTTKVPDNGSTLTLFGLGLLGLCGIAPRLRSIKG